MYTVLLPPSVNAIAVNKYIYIYMKTDPSDCLSFGFLNVSWEPGI